MRNWIVLKVFFAKKWLAGRPFAFFTLVMTTILVLGLSSCENEDGPDLEILIGIESDSIHLLAGVGELMPGQTGIDSLDAINEKWSVIEITPIFPDISSDDEAAIRYGLGGVFMVVVPAGTDFETLLAEYEADPHVAYAEMNQPVEIK